MLKGWNIAILACWDTGRRETIPCLAHESQEIRQVISRASPLSAVIRILRIHIRRVPTKSILHATGAIISRILGGIPALQYLRFLGLPDRKEVSSAKFSIQPTPRAAHETRHTHIPIASAGGLCLIKVHTALIQTSTLRSANSSSIPKDRQGV